MIPQKYLLFQHNSQVPAFTYIILKIMPAYSTDDWGAYNYAPFLANYSILSI